MVSPSPGAALRPLGRSLNARMSAAFHMNGATLYSATAGSSPNAAASAAAS